MNFDILKDVPDPHDRYGINGDFNEPWMDRINPQLLRRYWIKKGMPKPLITEKHGIKIRSYGTPLGILDHIAKQPLFKPL